MRRAYLFLVLAFIHFKGFSQSVISNSAANSVFVGYENPISVMVENTNCDKLILKTDNGTITHSNLKCGYNWIPDSLGVGTLTLYKLIKKDTIFYGSSKFRVILIPLKLTLLGCNKDSISIKEIKELNKPILYSDIGGCGVSIMATKYSILAKRGNQILFHMENLGMNFNNETKELMNKLEVGDKLLFFDFQLIGLFENYNLPIAQFIITE